MQATLDLGYNRSFVSFTWSGFDEMNGVSGDGHAELLDDDSIEITFAYHNGDEAVLKAKPEASSTACWIRPNQWSADEQSGQRADLPLSLGKPIP
jgi:hypothetical protein